MTTGTYEQLLSDAAAIREKIDGDLWPKYKELSKKFEAEYPEFKKSDFKLVADLVYYQGGWPSLNSKPKEEDLADRVAAALRLEKAIDRNRLVELLSERGIEVSLRVEDLARDRKLTLRDMVSAAQGLQKEMCHDADEIKIAMAEVAEEQFKVEKANFVKAVKIAASGNRKKIEKKIAKVEETAANLEVAIEPLKE